MGLEQRLIEILKKTTSDFEDGMENEWEKIEIPMKIAVHREKAKKYKEELVSVLKKLPKPQRRGPVFSYMDVGAVIGSQGFAFRLFALGEFLGLWRVETPQRLGFSGEKANRMCGLGGIGVWTWV